MKVGLFPMQVRDAAATELLDATALDDAALRRNLRDIRHINAILGWTAFSRLAVARYVKAQHLAAFTLLDVASGSADIPLAIARWAQQTGIQANITACDINPQIVHIAREQAASMPNITVSQVDALALPFSPGTFDVVLCTLALHHFAPDHAVALLRSMARVGHHIMVFDVVRAPLAYVGAVLLTQVGRMERMTRHDAPVSVRRAYSESELAELASRAGLRQTQIRLEFPFRLALQAAGNLNEA